MRSSRPQGYAAVTARPVANSSGSWYHRCSGRRSRGISDKAVESSDARTAKPAGGIRLETGYQRFPDQPLLCYNSSRYAIMREILELARQLGIAGPTLLLMAREAGCNARLRCLADLNAAGIRTLLTDLRAMAAYRLPTAA